MQDDWLYRISPCVNIVGRGETSEWLDPLRVIYDHELMCFGEGGRHRIELEGTVHECGPNSFIIIPPGHWHVGTGQGTGHTLRTWVHFDWVFTQPIRHTPTLTYAPAEPEWDLVRRAPAFVPAVVRTGSLPQPDAFFDAHRRLGELFNHGTLRERTACRGLFLEMLLSLLAPEGEPVDTDRGSRTASDIRHALDNLAQRPFGAAPSIRTFLASLGRSYDHQARLFKAAYGATPLQYVNTRRIERAKGLLRETRLPVARIAEGLGFSDVVYFNRLFRKHTGTTPGAYRTRQSPRPPE